MARRKVIMRIIILEGGMGPRGDCSRLWRQAWRVVVAWMFVFSSPWAKLGCLGGTGAVEYVLLYLRFFYCCFRGFEASASGEKLLPILFHFSCIPLLDLERVKIGSLGVIKLGI